ncbi:sensor histidine kinase [Flavobacterium urocaniciphilum]|uniref:histidine kinase n=1 Tax=Flavobacterium urocaniciphilum TaxID=1299341 RepID=A0A1H9DTN8_9FLAO|nr:HAMP domain-containing sensor histidine kinase [Flavobacterium urocaniciphilum]SEQ16163.1 two-component system, OmpR family, phosphate regulon sensor histidine kinase PhoR [Flavobacterium urocaniciphilum]
MKLSRFNIVIVIGFLAIVGVIIMQLFIISNARKIAKKETEDKIFFALQDVLEKLYKDNQTGLLVSNQVERISENYFTVNVNYEFENTILEHYLISEFQKKNLDLDFEYAIYNCSSDQMAFSNHINSNGTKEPIKCPTCFTKQPEYTYYFAIRFPDIEKNYFKNLSQYWIFTSVLFLVLIIYVYSVLLMLKQKKYTELQKDFINNMSHEFKTPLASILIASNYVKQQNEIKENPKLSKYNQIIVNQTNKLNEHIEKILYVAKTESKQMLIDKSKFELKPVLDLVKDNIKLKYDKKIDININVDKAYKINADEFHIYNIVFNLVDNSVKYCESNPKIEINVHEKNKQLLIEIKDNGCGIPPKDLPFVFDKFFRVTRKDITNIEGFGIGLSYVKKICELHKWKIAIANNIDKGITVTIQINQKDYA